MTLPADEEKGQGPQGFVGPRPAVIAPSRLQRRGVETVHGLPAGSGEGDVEPGDDPLACVDDKPSALPASEGYEALVLELQAETQGSQSCFVESPAGRQIPGPQGDVVYRRSANGGLSSPFALRLSVFRPYLRLLSRDMPR